MDSPPPFLKGVMKPFLRSRGKRGVWVEPSPILLSGTGVFMWIELGAFLPCGVEFSLR